MDYQGGKAFGQKKEQQGAQLREENTRIVSENIYADVEDLEEKVSDFERWSFLSDCDPLTAILRLILLVLLVLPALFMIAVVLHHNGSIGDRRDMFPI